MIQVSGAYTGLVIDEPQVPSGVALLVAVPTSGATINGVTLGGSSQNTGALGVLRTRTAGAATNTNITVTGIASGDIITAIYNVTDGAIVDHTAFSVTSGNYIQSASVSTSGKPLLFEWVDVSA